MESGDTRAAFGDLLRKYRRIAGMTQEALAERAGYSTVYISMLERGERRPQTDTAGILAAALGLSAFDRNALVATLDRQGPSDLVGRKLELDLISRHLDGKGPPVLLFAGEPGIGKSRLLREARRLGQVRGWRVLEAGCARRGGQEPFAPLVGALQRYVREQTPDRLTVELEGCAALTYLLPEIAESVVPRPASGRDIERRSMLDALIRFVRQAAGPAGTLLVLDDMQWAGTDALDALVALLEAAAPVRVVAAYRDVEISTRTPLVSLFGDLAQAEWATHRSLTPLSDEDAGELLDSLLTDLPSVDPEIRAWTLRQAAGMPLFVVSFAHEVRNVTLSGQKPNVIPWDVAQAIRHRVSALGAIAGEVLGIAAIAGRSASRQILADVTGLSTDALLDALDGICRARLLTENGYRAYRFTHDVVREVIESDLSAARRTELHRRVAAALESSGGLDALAYHYAHSDCDDKAIMYLELAGDRAQDRFAHATAEGYYRELVDRLERTDAREETARARVKLGSTLTQSGRHDAALAALEGATRLYRLIGDREREWLTVARIGRVHERRGTPSQGIERIDMLRVLPHPPMPRAELEMDVVLAALFMLAGRYADQLAASDRAAAAAVGLGDDRLLAEAEVWRGCALNQLGRLEEGRAVLEAAIPLAEDSGELAALAHALNDIGFLTEAGGELEVSRHFKERALQMAEQSGDPVTIANMVFRCGQNAFLRGAWDEAERLFARGMSVSGSIGKSSISAYPPFGMALLALARRDLDSAHTRAEESLHIARNSDPQVERAALAVLAECDLRAGQAESAMARLREVGPADVGLGLHPVGPILAETLLALGSRDEALEVAERAVGNAREHRHRVALVGALCARALAAGSVEDLDEAAELARSIGFRYGEIAVDERRARMSHAVRSARPSRNSGAPAAV